MPLQQWLHKPIARLVVCKYLQTRRICCELIADDLSQSKLCKEILHCLVFIDFKGDAFRTTYRIIVLFVREKQLYVYYRQNLSFVRVRTSAVCRPTGDPVNL